MSGTRLSADHLALLGRLLDEKGIAPGTPALTRSGGDRKDAPLSFAQQRIWFFHRLQPTSTLYNIAGAARLRGRLDADALRRSLTETLRRHEILRTTYRLVDGRPVQRVEAPADLDLPGIDLTGLAPGERAAAERRWEDRIANEPFDLERDIPFRAALLRVAPDEHRFLLAQHHIATDGWSLGVFLRELATLYAAFAAGRPSPLPELPVQYADFARWQREWLTGEVERRQLDYWQERLAGAALLDLPTARPRPAGRTWDGDKVDFALPADLVRRLSALAEGERATQYMVMLAALTVVLSRWSGQRQVVVGSPIANRNRLDIEDLIGCFVNTLPLRLDTSGDPSFQALLGQARQVCLGGYANQDVAFERIVEVVKPERDVGGQTPLVRHMLGLHNAPRPVLDLADLTIDFDGLNTGKARFDIEFELTPTPRGGVEGNVWFATDLFDRDTATRLVDGVRSVLEAAATDARTPIDRMPIMAEPERTRVLERFSGSAAAGPAAGDPAGELARWRDAAAPDAVAVAVAGRGWSYHELAGKSAETAARLRELGLRPGEAVGLTPGGPAWTLAAALAALEAGAIVAAPGPGAAAVLTEAGATRPDACRAQTAEPAETAGPAGGRAQCRGLLGYAGWMRDTLGFRPGDAALYLGPGSGAAALVEPLAALILGGRAVAPDPARRAGAADQARLIAAERPSVITCTPSQLAGLLPALADLAGAAADPRPGHLLLGGEPPWPELLAQCARVLPDTTVWLLYRGCGLPVAAGPAAEAAPAARGMAAVGRPIAGAALYVLDGHAQPVPAGVTGELYIGGPAAPAGGRPEPPREPHPGPGRPRTTGDRARWRADGVLEVLGPAGAVPPAGGHRIEPADIRGALLAHPTVDRAEIIAGPAAAAADDGMAAYVSLRRDAEAVRGLRTKFEERYTGRNTEDDPALNPVAWTSPSTGGRLTAEDMRDWANSTVGRVLDLRPRRMLEIGCRTGQLLYRLAPRCEHYCATDLSARALARIRDSEDWLGGRTDAVRLIRQAPDERGDLEPASFDLVLISSIVQYCPDLDYLRATIAAAAEAARPGGTIVISDVRSLPLLPALHAAAARRLDPALPRAELRRLVSERAEQEDELLVDPAWFTTPAARPPGITGATVLVRSGNRTSELTGYRYDVLLRVGECAPAPARWLDWTADGLTPAAIDDLLAGAPEQFGIRGLPDAQVRVAARAMELIGDSTAATAAELWETAAADAGPGVEVPELFKAAARHGYQAVAGPAATGTPGLLDVVLRPVPADGPAAPLPEPLPALGPARAGPQGQANDVDHLARARTAVPQLRAHLRERLPEYMIPAALTVRRTWPVGPGGVLDAAQLRPAAAETARPGDHKEPRTDAERAIARIWADVLGLDRISVDEDFFTLGGHSLLGTEVVERVRTEFDVDLPLGQLFESPTVAAVASYLEKARRGDAPTATIRRIERTGYRRRTGTRAGRN